MENDLIRSVAEQELEAELFREQVEACKEKLRNKKKSWFPWRILIVNINEDK